VELRRQVRHLDVELATAITAQALPGAKQHSVFALLKVEEAAKRLRTSTDALYRKHKRMALGYVDPLDGRLKFTEQEIADYIRRQRRR
jgi:hypothetical protein